MSTRMVFISFCLGLLSATAMAQSFSPAMVNMFTELRQQPSDMARYVYLRNLLAHVSASDRPLALQMLATTESELGLYNEALRDFPLKSHEHAGLSVPSKAQWKSVDAADYIAGLATDRRLVLINEAHHDAHTRQLTLELLPRLRALGFNYFAAEALLDTDTKLMQRGYPVQTTGTEYVHEPSYGEIIRTAIKLGFHVIAYDVDGKSLQDRDSGQAENLYRKTFAKDPQARLFVHAGYAHIDKSKGRLGPLRPMAMYLQELSGIEPLSIDQTQFREQIPDEAGIYTSLIGAFAPKEPMVLINRDSGRPWSAFPKQYDVNVILPPAAGQGAVESGYIQPATIVGDSIRKQSMLTHIVNTQRPEWLTLHGQRTPLAISTTLCKVVVPCVVEARYIDEVEGSIAADRYAFMQGDTSSKLYLKPGRYRLSATDARGKILSDKVVEIDKPLRSDPHLD